MTEPKKTKQELTCPECEAAGTPMTFKDPRGRGNHRRVVHGVKGTSQAAIAYRKAKGNARAKLGRPPGSGKKKETAAEARTQRAARLATSLVGYAMGKLENLAHEIARENGLPEKEFTRIVAESLVVFVNR